MNAALTTRTVGERGLLVEVADNEAAQALFRFARAAPALDLEETVIGHRTVLLLGRRRRPRPEQLADWQARQGTGAAPREVAVRVTYDGPDLPAVAAACGFSPEEVVRRHRLQRYTVAFVGFAPGFAYLIGGDPALRPPRRESPRLHVDAGALAIAGEYSAVYPTASPGGWNVIGRSRGPRLLDPQGEPLSMLQPGDTVRFLCEVP